MADDKVAVLRNTLATIGFRGDPQSHVLSGAEGGGGGIIEGGSVLTLASCRISSRVIGYVSNLCALSTHFEFTIHHMPGHGAKQEVNMKQEVKQEVNIKQEANVKQEKDDRAEAGRVTIVMSDITKAHAQMMLKPGAFRDVHCHPSVTRRRVTMRMESSEMRDLKKNSAMHGEWLHVRFEVNMGIAATSSVAMHPVVKIGGDGGFLSIRRCVLVAEPCLMITQPAVRGNVHMTGPDEFIRRIAMMSNTKAVGAHFEIREGVDDIVKEEGGTMIDDMLASARFGAVVGSSNKRTHTSMSQSTSAMSTLVTPSGPMAMSPVPTAPTAPHAPHAHTAATAHTAGRVRKPCTLIVQVNKDGADQVIACPGQLVGAVVNSSPVYMLNTICRILSPFQRNAIGLVFGLGSESEVLWVSMDVRDARVNALVKSMEGYRKMGMTDAIPSSSMTADSAWLEANTGGGRGGAKKAKVEDTETNPASPPRTPLSSSAPLSASSPLSTPTPSFLHPRAPINPGPSAMPVRAPGLSEGAGSDRSRASPKGLGGSTKKS